MGVNLNIAIDGWDEFANGGMKQIWRDDTAFPKVYRSADPYEDDAAFRPSDFPLWRASIQALNCNVNMWMRGLDALEANPMLWIECSY
jgi:hypothetical protein